MGNFWTSCPYLIKRVAIKPDFLMQLAVDHLTNQSAQNIVGRIYKSRYDELDNGMSGTRISM